MLPLRDLQRRLSAALIADTVDPALLALVNGRGELGPAARVEIYADMFRTRLTDVLRDDYPRVLATLGDEAFGTLARRYLARHPSTHPSVRYVGRLFAGFVGDEEGLPPFLGDLARLEWARVEVFDGPDADPLRLSDLLALPAAEWPALRLRPIPASQVLECAWPVHEIWATAGDSPREATAGIEPRPCTIRVWREGWAVSHAVMGDLERRVFPLLQRGEPFARLCAAGAGDPEAAAREVGGLLMRWLEDGLLVQP
jgi:hypothetical protein